jgi:Fur family zinc uptake transcriptional regulator
MSANRAPAHQPFARADHDHGSCVAAALDGATRLCQRRGARLTELRRRILEQVWRSHAPRGAYAILATLQRQGRRAAPPTVYRALEFLLEHGLIHRIESLNAFVGCATPDQPHAGHFLICSACGASAEVDDRRIGAAVRESVADAGFKLERQTIELTGLCPSCQDTPAEVRCGRD